MKSIATLALTLMFLTGCAEKAVNLTTSQASVEPQGDPLPIGHPELELPPESREIKRMTVDMLAASIPVVAGNDTDGNEIAWTARGPHGVSYGRTGAPVDAHEDLRVVRPVRREGVERADL